MQPNEKYLADIIARRPHRRLNLFAQHTAPPQSTMNASSKFNFSLMGALILSALLVVLSIALIVLFIKIMQYRAALSQRRRRRRVKKKVDEGRLLRRYETIEGWLISKKALGHDNFCSSMISTFFSSKVDDCPKGIKNTISSEESRDHTSPCDRQECAICMSGFHEGEVVSWSANDKCTHAFHHECIKEWLVRHVECPVCRGVFLPVDEVLDDEKLSLLKYLSERHARRLSTTYFCVKEGLITVPDVVRCTKDEFNTLETRVCSSIVKRCDLAFLRGRKHEESESEIVGCNAQAIQGMDEEEGPIAPTAPPLRGSNLGM